ncbi:alpha/beta fold hydrolase [Gordonia sp. CPCC 205333]|uniref:alpha/beta fold hydrolase n=1 Tax=Gordonia sp. CPCC 205333 TaxID=3140790 RepID=UPI003AF33B07
MAIQRRYNLRTNDGAELFVSDAGAADPVATIVLLHGLSLTSEVWDQVSDKLTASSTRLRVISYDSRGHGGSSGGEPSLETLADDLAFVVGRLVPTGPLVLAGHSLGGMTMLALAQRHPDLVARRVTGAVFVATTPGLGKTLERIPGARGATRFVQMAVRHAAVPQRPAPLVRQFARGAFGAHPSRRQLASTIAQSSQAHMPAIASLIGSIADHDRIKVAATYRHAKVVVLAGGRDRFFAPSHSRTLAAGVAGRLVEYPSSGHMLPTEQADNVALQIAAVALEAVAV